ncbi:UNVERIFIED_CONTAM: hypothetical protein GTU68_035687 [Idotea baltica]|nr:hypothetical protein [Idotea baltica]
MTAITASMVKELRDRTGLPMMECKKALSEADGEIDLAIENLRKSSGMKAAKKAGRTAADGVVAVSVADDGKSGIIVEVNSETDFVARDENFLNFVDAVVQKASEPINPQVAKPEEMPAELLEKEKEIFSAQAAESGKPPEIVEKMVEGRMRKFLAENSLVEQAFVKDPDMTVGKLLSSNSADISSFIRYEVGEGIEKKEEDFAAEVAAQVQSAGS